MHTALTADKKILCFNTLHFLFLILPPDQHKKFMNPASEMIFDLPEIIQDQCHKLYQNIEKKNIYYLKYLLMTNNGKKKKKGLKKLLKAF